MAVALGAVSAAQLPPADPSFDPLAAAAQAALVRGEGERAVALATRAIDAAPEKPVGYALRAAAYDALRDYEKSVPDYTKVLSLLPNHAPALRRRGEAFLRLGRFRESVADFDREVALAPDREAYHWQRGISLYYAGEYARGAKQFELHRTVNPDDVENAAWHYLCVARQSGVDAARQSLIPVQGDLRVPMAQIHALYAGKAKAEDVVAAAEAGDPPANELKRRLLYAHLYIGLYHEAADASGKAREHVKLAADKYAQDGDYMSDVAGVHMATRHAIP